MDDFEHEAINDMVRVDRCFDGTIIGPNASDINYMAWNINHLTNKLHLVEQYIAIYPGIIHVIAISETWLADINKSTYNLRDYVATHNVRQNGAGGGITIYAHQTICQISPKVLVDIVTPDRNHFLVIEIPYAKVIVAVPYTRPDKNDEQRHIDTFIDEFERYCLGLFNCMILGDMNLNQLDENHRIRLADLLEANGTALLNEISTRGVTRPQSGTIIDLCMTNMLNVGHKLSIVHNLASDHCILFVSTSNKIKHVPTTNIKTKLNINNAARMVEEKVASNSFICGNELNTALSQIINECTSSVNVRSNHRIQRCHIDRELILAIRERDRLASMKRLFPLNNIIDKLLKEKIEWIKCRNFELKSAYETDRIEAAAGDDRKTWQIYKEIIFNQYKSKSDATIEINGTAIKDDVASCNAVNDYFCTAGEKLASDIISVNGYNIDDIDELYNEHAGNDWDFQHVNPEQVSAVIRKLPNKKSTSFDKVPMQLFKLTVTVIALAIATCFNTMITVSEYPVELLKGRLKLIHKSGTCDIDNFRGLTLLPSLSKIFEELLLQQLYGYLESLHFFIGNQFGFLKNSSCQSAALQFVDFVKSNCKNKFVGAIFIDLKKAFDTVDNKRLLRKLKRLGLSARACKLMESYLLNRETATAIGDKISDFRRLQVGVMQGSKLGPIQFVIYINDLLKLNFNGQLLLYADDAVLVYAADSPTELQSAMQNDANLLNEWLGRNVLSLNKVKTCYMLFGRAKSMSDLNVRFDGSSIKRVRQFKYLGLIIDDGLTFHDHINHVKRKITPFISLMWRKSKYIPIAKRKQLYNAYVQSHLLYMLPIYSECAQYQLDELQILQNRCVKALLRLNRYTPTTYLYSTGLMPLIELVKTERIVLIHRLVNSLTKNNFTFVSNAEVHGRVIRRGSRIHIFNQYTTRSSSYVRNAALSSSLNEYNDLNSETRKLRCFKTFKSTVKLKILETSRNFHVISPYFYIN